MQDEKAPGSGIRNRIDSTNRIITKTRKVAQKPLGERMSRIAYFVSHFLIGAGASWKKQFDLFLPFVWPIKEKQD